MKTIKEKFINAFGKEETERMEKAALEHSNRVNNENTGRDPFKWAILICIGYECFTRFRDYHGFVTPPLLLKKWIKENAELGSHNGDCDYLSLFAGVYNEYMPNKEEK